MPVRIEALRSAATRYRPTLAKSLTEARAHGLPTVFLCHSHRDEELVKGLLALFEESGWSVYVDWADASMPDVPNRETADRIKRKIVDLNYFLFLATSNSISSRWCPWEIGYADGKKPIERILVLPTTDGFKTYGNEYLQLYRHIDLSNLSKLAVWQPGQTTNGILLKNLRE
ncbi:MAG: toll/interleukin-1 receptor domain-containing protein [Nitrospira sp.]|nr:toll/interleukin-1 receptor domain-containing protein [Nitrospira sp.]